MAKEILSKNNQYIKLARALQQKKYREKEKLFLIEGITNALEAINADWPIAFGFYTEDLLQDNKGSLILSALEEKAEVFLLSQDLIAAIATTEQPQPIVLIGRQREYLPEEFMAGMPGQVVLLDGLQDPGNIGTIFRTSWAAGAKGILLTEDCADICNSKTVRSAMGGLYHMPFFSATREKLLDFLYQYHYKIYLADAKGVSYKECNLNFPLCFVLGNEANGLHNFWQKSREEKIAIPQMPNVESLNVAIACGILLFAAKKD